MDDDIPCPECEGWMSLRGNRWECPTCGHRSEEFVDEEAEAVAASPTEADLAVEQGVATSSPSYRKPSGRPRSFGVGLALGIVTLGLYFLFWQWTVFDEVHRQERSRGRAWMLGTGLLAFPAGVIGLVVRGPPESPRDLTPGDLAFVGLAFAGVGLALAYLFLETFDLDEVLAARGLPATHALGWLAADAVLGAIGIFAPKPLRFLLGLVRLAVALVAYWRLQDGLNRYWDAVRFQPAPSSPTALTPVPS